MGLILNFTDKRFTIWKDEGQKGTKALKLGLIYGVYDNKLNRKCTFKEQSGIIKALNHAFQIADKLNKTKGYNISKMYNDLINGT